jgi:hypothetical protein
MLRLWASSCAKPPSAHRLTPVIVQNACSPDEQGTDAIRQKCELVLPFAPPMEGALCVDPRADFLCDVFLMTTICEAKSRVPATVRRLFTSTSISCRGREGLASHLAASPSCHQVRSSEPSSPTCSKEPVSMRRDEGTPRSPFGWVDWSQRYAPG